MQFLVDTNIFLHAANQASPVHRSAREFLRVHLHDRTPWCTTWPIVYEFLRVATHAKVFPRPLSPIEAHSFVRAVVEAEEVTVLHPTRQHLSVLEAILKDLNHPGGNLFHDIHTATIMKEHGVTEIATGDRDFLQFPFLRVRNPLTSE